MTFLSLIKVTCIDYISGKISESQNLFFPSLIVLHVLKHLETFGQIYIYSKFQDMYFNLRFFFHRIVKEHQPGNPVPGPGQLVQHKAMKKKKVPPPKLGSNLDLRIVECARYTRVSNISIEPIRTCKNLHLQSTYSTNLKLDSEFYIVLNNLLIHYHSSGKREKA